MAAIKEVPAADPDFLPGHALVGNDDLQGLLYTAGENNAGIYEELEKYVSLCVPVLVPISTLQRWHRAVLIPADADE